MDRRPFHGMTGPVSIAQSHITPNVLSFPGAINGNVSSKYLPVPATAAVAAFVPNARLQHHLQQDRSRLPALVPVPSSATATTARPKFIEPVPFHPAAYRYPLTNSKMHHHSHHHHHHSHHQQATSPSEHAGFHLVGFEFTREDLDMVLYGYAKGKENDPSLGLALSGLRIGELSYGIDRILGQSSPRSTISSHVDPNSIELPDGLELKQTTFAGMLHYGIFCKKTVITKGTKFGPFQGKIVNMSEIKTNDDNSFMWEIFKDGKLSHFIDGRGNAGNWMAYVNCARYAQEQNLVALQTDGQIHYEACKDIPEGTELLVWYGETYMQFMGIPICLKDTLEEPNKTDHENSEGFACERCGKVFAYQYYRDKHLKYTRCVDQGNRKFPCHLCTRSFEKRDRLRIHILHVHEKHRPHKCHVCGKSFSQSSSLNKHMRVHSGERPYKCVYCSKAFTASSILRTHIRQHSGEKPFKCKHCGKAFASHAAHDSHVRRTHAKEKMGDINMNKKIEDHIDVVSYETAIF